MNFSLKALELRDGRGFGEMAGYDTDGTVKIIGNIQYTAGVFHRLQVKSRDVACSANRRVMCRVNDPLAAPDRFTALAKFTAGVDQKGRVSFDHFAVEITVIGQQQHCIHARQHLWCQSYGGQVNWCSRIFGITSTLGSQY